MVSKTKKVSMKKKISWRKHINIDDVDNFLEEKRRDERIGEIPASALVIDRSAETKLTRKMKAQLPSKVEELLKPRSAVPDPVGKRNRVRTKEERKHPLRKKLEEQRKEKGILSEKALKSKEDRKLFYKKKVQKLNKALQPKDAWTNKIKGKQPTQTKWLSENARRVNLPYAGQSKVKKPDFLAKKTSILPSIEPPHPGASYNPSYKDHQDLLRVVAEKEMKKIKEEAHINRVTTAVFSKVSPDEKERDWLEQMSEGLFKTEEEEGKAKDEEKEEEGNNEYKAINKPVSIKSRKTMQQRRRIREEKEATRARQAAKIEKKKTADIYKLRFLQKEMTQKDEKLAKRSEKREEKKKLAELGPKRLSKTKFEAPDEDFLRGCELRGSLRLAKPVGNLMADRFYSFQKRNIVAPSLKRTTIPKAKVKRFVKPNFREEEEPTVSSVRQKLKLKR